MLNLINNPLIRDFAKGIIVGNCYARAMELEGQKMKKKEDELTKRIVCQFAILAATFFNINESLKSAHLLLFSYCYLGAACCLSIAVNTLAINCFNFKCLKEPALFIRKFLPKACLFINVLSAATLLNSDKKIQGMTFLAKIIVDFLSNYSFLGKSYNKNVERVFNLLELSSVSVILPSYFKLLPICILGNIFVTEIKKKVSSH